MERQAKSHRIFDGAFPNAALAYPKIAKGERQGKEKPAFPLTSRTYGHTHVLFHLLEFIFSRIMSTATVFCVPLAGRLTKAATFGRQGALCPHLVSAKPEKLTHENRQETA